MLIERDIYLTTWILAWDTHALTHDPTHLFQANVFYPAPSSLARSEHMLGSVPLFAPVYLATGNPKGTASTEANGLQNKTENPKLKL